MSRSTKKLPTVMQNKSATGVAHCFTTCGSTRRKPLRFSSTAPETVRVGRGRKGGSARGLTGWVWTGGTFGIAMRLLRSGSEVGRVRGKRVADDLGVTDSDQRVSVAWQTFPPPAHRRRISGRDVHTPGHLELHGHMNADRAEVT
jgi:hypothetical protein